MAICWQQLGLLCFIVLVSAPKTCIDLVADEEVCAGRIRVEGKTWYILKK